MSLACVVLAAGLSKRMNSSTPKVLHKICGLPMLQHVINAAEKLRPGKKIIVAGKNCESIRREIKGSGISYVLQKEPKGTGDALLAAVEALRGYRGVILALNGDMPLITVQTLRRILNFHRKNNNALSVLSFIAQDPSSYGRILRDSSGKTTRILEDRDAAAGQRKIKEVNSGVYLISPDCAGLLKDIRRNKAKGEYYLTDLLEMAAGKNLKTGAYCIGSENELLGVNNRQEMLRAEKIMQGRVVDRLIKKNVRFLDTASVHIHLNVSIGRDTVIYPNVYLEGNTRIGYGCIVYPNVRIVDCVIENNAAIKDSSVLEGSVVRRMAQIGPFAHIRPGSVIGAGAKIGNFVEVKKSMVGDGTKASHLSYLGDAVIGKGVNIGAGTITCNYDGEAKHKTVISEDVFIGSDTQLIAPVKIGRGAYVGAGSTITRDVPPMTLAISRVKQENIEGWVLKKQSKLKRSGLKGKKQKGKNEDLPKPDAHH